MFIVFALAYANQGNIWENLGANQYKPETEREGCTRSRVSQTSTKFFSINLID